MIKYAIKYLLIFVLSGSLWSAQLKPVNPRQLPEHMRSYKNYLIVLVHGMNSSAEIWEENNVPDLLASYVGDPSFCEHVFAYTFNNPNASYHENAAQIGDRQDPQNWLARARREFIAKHPSWPEAELPQKYILITHSMGALSARSYIYSDTLAATAVDVENFKYGFYENDIKKVVFVAPTHVGSSMADFLFYYMASDEGYDKEASGLLKQIINTLDLKNDTFESAWQKAQQKAQMEFDNYLQALLTTLPRQNSGQGFVADNFVLGAALSGAQLRVYLQEIMIIYYEEAGAIAGATDLAVIAQARAAAAEKIKLVKQKIIAALQQSMLNYGNPSAGANFAASAGEVAYNNNGWFREKAGEAIAAAVEKFSSEIYRAISEGEDLFSGEIKKKSEFENWEELVAYLNQIIAFIKERQSADGEPQQQFNFKEWLDGQIAEYTEFKSWEELTAFVKTLKAGDQLEVLIVQEMQNRKDLDNYVVLMETLSEQNNDSDLKQKLDILTKEYTQFKTFEELQTKLVNLKIEEIAAPQLDSYVRTNTEFESYRQLLTYLKSMSITAELKKQLDLQVAQYTEFETWEQLEQYVKNLSLQAYLKAQADLAVKEYTGFESIEALQAFIASLNLEQEWNKYFNEVKNKMENEGYSFVINLEIKDWPLEQQPKLNVNWHNWTQFTPDLELLKKDITEMLDNYRFRVKIMDDAEFSASVKEIKNMISKVTSWNNPLTKLFKIITEIDTAPIGSFPTVKLLIEVNNYCAADQVKKMMDFFFTEIMNKKAISDGAITSLLKEDPATVILKNAELPTAYEPVQYRNIIPRGMVAFNKRESQQFNQCYYGDLPALRGAFSQVDNFIASSSFLSTAVANGYQLKLLTSANFQRLPSGEARLGALLLSYARGLFTIEGDGLVDIDSMHGKEVKSLAGAQNYYEKFVTKELSDYVDRGFIEDTVEAEAICLLVELAFRLGGGTTPPYVKGAIRLVPLFNFISIVANNSDKIMADIAAHGSILKEERLSGHLQNAIYDKPLVVLHSLYAVSGNEKIKIGVENFQPQTDPNQTVTTVPIVTAEGQIYLPMAYNFKVNKVTLEGELYDFAPQLAQLEYSFNFAPFEKITVDQWGKFSLNELAIAEGQNVIAFRVTNKPGITNNQFMRIIRSTSPLIASNLYPQPFSYTNETVVPLSVDYYNAQFISNNIEASQIDRLLVNGQEIPKNLLEIKRGYDDEYRNYARVLTVVSLTEGPQRVELLAHDTYGHKSYTAWNFNIDTTPPSVKISLPAAFSPILDGKLKIELTVSDNLAVVLNNLQSVIKDKNGTNVYHFPVRTSVTAGDHLLYFFGEDDYNEILPDGEYQLAVRVNDLAGNKGEATATFNIDTIAPTVLSQKFGVQTISTARDKITYQAILNEPSSVLLQLYNIDKEKKYTYTLNEYEIKDGQYLFSYVFQTAQNELTEGRYFYYADVFDLAGNYAQTVSADLLVDCTPPELFGLHARPLVLTREQAEPYQAKIEYQVKDEGSPLLSGTRKIEVKALIKRKSDQVVVFDDLLINDLSGVYLFNWSANSSELSAGVYSIELTASDIWGNKRKAYTEVIKDGILPEISVPKDNARVAGIVSLIGRITDSNWSNIKDFEKYILYWAADHLAVPQNLNNLDSAVWRTTALDVPFINRKNGETVSNVSYREVQKDTLIGYWNTQGLPDGKYTLLAVAYEDGLGATAATGKHLVVDSSLAREVVSPYAALKTKVNNIDFAVSPNLALTFFNANKKANIGIEIIAPDGEVAFYKTFVNVEGLKYYGRPDYKAGGDKGLFIWADEAGWHLRLSAGTTKNVSCNVKIAGVVEVGPAAGVASPVYSLNSGMLIIKDEIAAGTERGFDLILNKNITSLYIESDLGEKSLEEIARDGADLVLGKAAYRPKYNPYIIELAENNLAGNFNLNWNGLLPGGGYASDGIYIVRVSAAGYDGLGFNSSMTTFNVKTPFVFAGGTVVPENKKFDAFDPEMDRLSVGFTANKDCFITAKVYNKADGLPVAALQENRKYPGSPLEKKIVWNGAFPLPNSTQRKIEGKYDIVLTAETVDGSARSTLNYENIEIIKNTGSAVVAGLAPLGVSVPFNGETVQATKGDSDYYWSAHGSGTYSVPQSFKYKVAAEGEQIISINPTVPFAGLYHRGFETVKNISVHLYVRYYEGVAGNGNASSRDGDIYNLKITTSNVAHANFFFKEESGFGGFSRGSLEIKLDGITMLAYDISGFGTLGKKTYDRGLLVVKNFSGIRYPDPNRNTSVLRYYDINFDVDLLDSVRYSRLTNRFHAYYGYVNASVPNSRDFKTMLNDYDELAFVPPEYFTEGNSVLADKLFPALIREDISIDFYIRYYQGAAGNGNADSKSTGIGDILLNESKTSTRVGATVKENDGMGRFDSGYINVYLGGVLVATYQLTSFYSIKETYNNGLIELSNYSVSRYGDGGRTNANKLKYYQFDVDVKLRDIKTYTKLTKGITMNYESVDIVTADQKLGVALVERINKYNAEMLAFVEEVKPYLSGEKLRKAHYSYLDDEYFEFIPLAIPVPIDYEAKFVTHNIDIGDGTNREVAVIEKITVNTNFSTKGQFAWPVTEEKVTEKYNEQYAIVHSISNPKAEDIESIDYTTMPVVIEKSSIDIGGFGRSFHEISGILSKHDKYQENVAEIFDPAAEHAFPDNVIRDSVTLKLLDADNPDIELSFNNGEKSAKYSNDLSVIAKYSDSAGSETIQSWSTERDPFINNGIIDSRALLFNENEFRPESDYVYIADAYFDAFNRPAEVVTQSIHPINFYTFLEHSFYNPQSGRIINPNLDLEKWSIAIYDRSGALNQDLEVTDVNVDSEDIYNNKFKVKLKLDAVEKRLVEISGEADGPYELLYFDGTIWETIATGNQAVSGRLAWWDVGRLNGLYSIVLRVYEGEFGNSPYNLTKQELHIGELLKFGLDDAENKRVTSPYKRAEVYFHPNSYNEDKFITVTPVNLNELNISNRPDVYSVGPIVEILPHGSEFPETEKRPELVFRYSHEDIQELRQRGIDIDKLGLHYLNESGEVENANSEVLATDYGLEIRTVLSHFSPYAVLEGRVPALPTVNAAFSMFNSETVKIYGLAEPNTTLEIIIDDDSVFGDRDGLIELRQKVVADDIAGWIFNNRNWSEDYIGKLNESDRSRVFEQRNSLLNKVQQYIRKNEQNKKTWQDLYQELVAQEAANVALIKNYLSSQQGLINKNSGVQMINDSGLQLECAVPTFDACLPEELFIERIEKEIVRQGAAGHSYFLQTDAAGRFEYDIKIPVQLTELYVYVTYALNESIKNRPVARIDFGNDPEAPVITTVNMRTVVNQKNKGEDIPVSLVFSEECKLITYLYDQDHNLLKVQTRSDFFAAKQETKFATEDLLDGEYFCSFVAVDSAGNASRPVVSKILVDTIPPQKKDLALPAYINPEKRALQIICPQEQAIIVKNIKIFYNNILVDHSATDNFKFKAVNTGSGCLNGEYQYLIELADIAENESIITGSIIVDTVAPETPQDFNLLNVTPRGIETIWSPVTATDLAEYLLVVKNNGEFVATLNIPFSKYYDLQITRNSFYKYELYARDHADNLSTGKQQLLAYAGENCAQKTVLKNETMTITYNECELFVPVYATEESALFVVQQLGKTEYPRPHVPGRVYITNAYCLLASEQTNFKRPLSIKFNFDTEIVTKNQLRQETLRIAYWNGCDWSAEGLTVRDLNIAAGEILVETDHFTDFILLADMEYGAYDDDLPVLRFDSLRNGDYLDPEVSFNVMVSDATSAINSENMALLLDGVSYNIPSVAFISEEGSAGQRGIVAINIKNIVGDLTKGKHQLRVIVYDLGNNSNQTPLITFSTEPDFSIRDILTVPSPFGREGTHFTYQLSQPVKDIEVRVYTTNGRLVKEIKNCSNQAGFNKTFWDGKDLNGQFVANDVYLYTVIVTDQEGERSVYKGKTAAIR